MGDYLCGKACACVVVFLPIILFFMMKVRVKEFLRGMVGLLAIAYLPVTAVAYFAFMPFDELKPLSALSIEVVIILTAHVMLGGVFDFDFSFLRLANGKRFLSATLVGMIALVGLSVVCKNCGDTSVEAVVMVTILAISLSFIFLMTWFRHLIVRHKISYALYTVGTLMTSINVLI